MMKDQMYDYAYDDKGDDKYCYSHTSVLKNKAGIRKFEKLAVFEREYSTIRATELLEEGVTGDFSLAHLQEIHRYLFQDIYNWAGEIRTVDIAKGNIFCLVQFIETQYETVYAGLREADMLQHISVRSEMVKKLAFYLAEINAVHPFREGNGRAQRAYIQQLCMLNGRFFINFNKTRPEDMVEASIASLKNVDYSLMEKVIDACLIDQG